MRVQAKTVIVEAPQADWQYRSFNANMRSLTAAPFLSGDETQPGWLSTTQNLIRGAASIWANKSAAKDADAAANNAKAMRIIEAKRMESERALASRAAEISARNTSAEAAYMSAKSKADMSKYLIMGGVAVAALAAVYFITRKKTNA